MIRPIRSPSHCQELPEIVRRVQLKGSSDSVNVQKGCSTCSSFSKSFFAVSLGSHDPIFCDQKLETSFRAYKKRQWLMKQGYPVHGVFCVSKGKVKILKTLPNGKEMILRIAKEGDLIGAEEVFSKHLHGESSAISLGPVEACFVKRERLMEFADAFPDAYKQLAQKLSRELSLLGERSAFLAYESAETRLRGLLQYLRIHFGLKEGHGSFRIDVQLNREELASMAGIATETCIRLISRLKEAGELRQEGKTLFVEQKFETVSMVSL
jgi:CRP-like cAMP-binding protein